MIRPRENLAARYGTRFRCPGRVAEIETVPAYRGPDIQMILFHNIAVPDPGFTLTNELWLTAGKWSEGACVGDTVEFDARLTDHIRSHQGFQRFYGWTLHRPTKVKITKPVNVADLRQAA